MTKSGKHCVKRRNCTFWAISSFVTMFSKKPSAAEASESVYMRERVNKCVQRTDCLTCYATFNNAFKETFEFALPEKP